MSQFGGSADALKKLRTKATYEKKKHFNAQDRKKWWGHFLRISVIVMNVFTTSVLFSILNDLFKDAWQYAAALVALTSALFVALSEYFKFEAAVVGHRTYGNRFAYIANKCDLLLSKLSDGLVTPDTLVTQIDALNEDYDQALQAAAEFPTSKKDYQTARAGFKDGEESYTDQEMR